MQTLVVSLDDLVERIRSPAVVKLSGESLKQRGQFSSVPKCKRDGASRI